MIVTVEINARGLGVSKTSELNYIEKVQRWTDRLQVAVEKTGLGMVVAVIPQGDDNRYTPMRK